MIINEYREDFSLGERVKQHLRFKTIIGNAASQHHCRLECYWRFLMDKGRWLFLGLETGADTVLQIRATDLSPIAWRCRGGTRCCCGVTETVRRNCHSTTNSEATSLRCGSITSACDKLPRQEEPLTPQIPPCIFRSTLSGSPKPSTGAQGDISTSWRRYTARGSGTSKRRGHV